MCVHFCCCSRTVPHSDLAWGLPQSNRLTSCFASCTNYYYVRSSNLPYVHESMLQFRIVFFGRNQALHTSITLFQSIPFGSFFPFDYVYRSSATEYSIASYSTPYIRTVVQAQRYLLRIWLRVAVAPSDTYSSTTPRKSRTTAVLLQY